VGLPRAPTHRRLSLATGSIGSLGHHKHQTHEHERRAQNDERYCEGVHAPILNDYCCNGLAKRYPVNVQNSLFCFGATIRSLKDWAASFLITCFRRQYSICLSAVISSSSWAIRTDSSPSLDEGEVSTATMYSKETPTSQSSTHTTFDCAIFRLVGICNSKKSVTDGLHLNLSFAPVSDRSRTRQSIFELF
jgi:hypothetical protein